MSPLREQKAAGAPGGRLCVFDPRESPWAGLLEDVFSQNGIAFVVKREKGAALAIRTGPAFEGFRFYVPYCQLTQAGELMRAILDGGGDLRSKEVRRYR